jgi:multidrug resistance efflux pump
MNNAGLSGAAMDVPRRASRSKWRRPALYVGLVVLIVLGGLSLRHLRPAAPVADKATMWIGEVQRGSMLREIQGQGTLVPEDIRWISAFAPARVERVMVRPGAQVDEDTVLVVLSNPDMELAALEAERQVASAQSDLANLRASLEGQRLAQQSLITTLGSELGDARRRAIADDDLAKKGFLSELERGESRDRATERAGRLEFEQKRLVALGRGHTAQIAAQEQQLERQRSIAEVRRKQVDDLRVRAGVRGVLQQLPLQPGQSVEKGALLAKVARPDKLKAEIRVPEVQAKDLQLGLPVTIDTHSGVAPGHLVRIDPAVQSGFVKVDALFDAELPAGARPDLSVAAVIQLERLDDVLFIEHPAGAQADATIAMFRVAPDGDAAIRTQVHLGRSSAKTMEVLEGLVAGDRVILSDTTLWSSAERLRLR